MTGAFPRFYFVRHGESEANVLHQFSNRGCQHPLTETGRRQAEQLAERLLPEGIDCIFSSPLLRAVETTRVLAKRIGVRCKVRVTDALREYDCGELEDRADEVGWEVYRQVSSAWLDEGRYDVCPPGGESFTDMQARFLPFIERLLETYRGTAARLALVSHGGLYRCMLPLVLPNVDHAYARAHPLGNTEFVVAEARPQGLLCLAWGGNPMAGSFV